MKKIIILFIFFYIFSCNSFNSSTLQNEFKNVDVDKLLSNYEKIKIDDCEISYEVPKINSNEHRQCKIEQLFDSLYVVKLETNDNNIIGAIDELTIVNDTIYVLDSWSTKTVCLFDMTGKFIRKIGRVGNGPGEYVEPTSFSVDDKNILIYDQWQHKGLKYDHSGNLLSEHWLPFLCFKIIELPNGDVLCYGNDEDNEHLPEILDYKFWVCDSSYNTIKKVGYFHEHNKYIRMMIRGLYNYNGYRYYFDNKDNAYYKIKDNGDLELLFTLKFGNEKDDRFYMDDNYSREMMIKGERYFITHCLKLNNVITYSVPTIGPRETVFHNIVDNRILHYSGTEIWSSQMSRVLFLSEIKTCYKDCFVYCLSPEKILSVNKQIMSQIPDLWSDAPRHVMEFDKKLLESLHDEDNDILIFAKVKEHFD